MTRTKEIADCLSLYMHGGGYKDLSITQKLYELISDEHDTDYKGFLYRGMAFDDEYKHDTITNVPLASWTTNVEDAINYARMAKGPNKILLIKKGTGYLLSTFIGMYGYQSEGIRSAPGKHSYEVLSDITKDKYIVLKIYDGMLNY